MICLYEKYRSIHFKISNSLKRTDFYKDFNSANENRKFLGMVYTSIYKKLPEELVFGSDDASFFFHFFFRFPNVDQLPFFGEERQ